MASYSAKLKWLSGLVCGQDIVTLVLPGANNMNFIATAKLFGEWFKWRGELHRAHSSLIQYSGPSAFSDFNALDAAIGEQHNDQPNLAKQTA